MRLIHGVTCVCGRRAGGNILQQNSSTRYFLAVSRRLDFSSKVLRINVCSLSSHVVRQIGIRSSSHLSRFPIACHHRFFVRTICSKTPLTDETSGSKNADGEQSFATKAESQQAIDIKSPPEKPPALKPQNGKTPPPAVIVSSKLKLKRLLPIDEFDAKYKYRLSEKDLEGLHHTVRRSSYLGEPLVRVLREPEVRDRAIEVHGTPERVDKLVQMWANLQGKHAKAPRSFRSRERQDDIDSKRGMKSASGKVVRFAVAMNCLDATSKYVGWVLTGSSSMFAEAMHATADTLNQLILAFGIQTGSWKPSAAYPYGYGQMRYVTSLISGVGIFFVGCGVSVYHGVENLISPHELEPLSWALVILTGSLLFQSSSLYRAYNTQRAKALQNGMTIWQYVGSGRDPTVNVVLMEDLIAVSGVLIAFSSICASVYFNSPIPDAIGSIVIGGLMGCVASYIIKTNTMYLLGQSVSHERREEIIRDLKTDHIITSVHDVKATSVGPGQIRLKAEVDFDGHAIMEAYLRDNSIYDLRQRILAAVEREEELHELMCELAEGIMDQLGKEVDRVETELKHKHPYIRHTDLEPL